MTPGRIQKVDLPYGHVIYTMGVFECKIGAFLFGFSRGLGVSGALYGSHANGDNDE